MKFDASMLLTVAQTAGVPEEDVALAVAAALEAAYSTQADALPGVKANIELETGAVELRDPDGNFVPADNFGVRGAMAARQAIVSWLRDVERLRKVGPWADLEGAPIRATVKKVARDGEVRLDVEGTTAILPAGEAIPTDNLAPGDEVTVLLLAANVTDRDAIRLTVSRRQPALVAELFNQHLLRGRSTAAIASIAREPGVRTKIACTAEAGDPRQDFIGPLGATVRSVTADLSGETIDLIPYSADLATYVASALSPAPVLTAEVTDATRRAVRVTVAPGDVAAADGVDGVNARLASKLTGARIEIVAAA